MKRIINITDANEVQVKQKLSKNAKITAWLLAGAIATVGIEAGVNYFTDTNNSVENNYEESVASFENNSVDEVKIGRSK